MSASGAKRTLCVIALICLAVVLGLGVCLHYSRSGPKRGAIRGESYYRAVYVLQSLGGPADKEKEEIPARIPYLDETESLLHHPDKILVLRRIARDLEETGRDMPKAPLFEAYARLALGERESAVALLTRFVVESEYNARYYTMLCENLYALSDYTSLLLICREWAERDEQCFENRVFYLWAALQNLGRYADAAQSLAGAEACLGWRLEVYKAKSVAAQGQREEAETLVEQARARRPEDAHHIRRMWEQLRDQEQV